MSRTESKIKDTRRGIHKDDEEVVEGAAAQLSHQLANLFRQKLAQKTKLDYTLEIIQGLPSPKDQEVEMRDKGARSYYLYYCARLRMDQVAK